MVIVVNRAQRVLESAAKIEPPFVLDETLCLYSPQDNVGSLEHPRIADWLRFIRHDYVPQLPGGKRRVLLLMPCTKTKPYPFSSEHQHINQRLLAAGFRPTRGLCLPKELQARLTPEFSPDVLNLSPLIDDRGIVIHRMVISEPMALVPYECVVEYDGKASPATAYDDPGLFENRGNAVSPWRPECTAVAVSATRWRWGDEERRHYVLMHNAMAEAIAATITRIADRYAEIVSWVAPGLTHRSFVLARGERAANNVRSFRQVGVERLELIGANDHLPPDRQIECLPTLRQCREAVIRLAKRLRTTTARARGVYARGGANATPLTLPELLDVLVARVTGGVAPALSSGHRSSTARSSLKPKVANAIHSVEDRRQRQRPHATLGRSAGDNRRR